MLTCPKCGNDNQSMFDCFNHLRNQMDVNCQVCAHTWVQIHKEVPKENILPKVITRAK